MSNHDRCPRCGKVLFRHWRHAEADCKSIRRHVKSETTLRPYYSRRCQAVHLTHSKTRRKVAA